MSKDEEIIELKRFHNGMHAQGHALLKQMEALADQVMDLRVKIEELEGRDYDPIRILFAGTYWIEGEE
jgi:hypothetical protein